jgi:DNA-binding transcriptional regulator LsrR (DeoR family)
MAEVIASREGAKDFEVAEIASVLHLSYEREVSHQAIARHLGIDHRTVDEIISASSELLRSGDVSVERVAV